MSQQRNRSVVTGLAAVIAVGLVAGGVYLTAERGTDDPTIGGATTTRGAAPAPSGDGTVTITRTGPDLPGGDVLDRCGSSSRSAVAEYDTDALGRITMQCGTSAQGYEHIRVRHTADWQEVVAGHGSRDWDDAMLTAVQTALEDPRTGFPLDAGDGKVCYAAPVRFDDGSRPDADPFVKVIVSATTDRVITAYPTRTDDC
ncbi:MULTISPECIES: hypothetical protein [unclassified Curtobacterium]|uniref:hypothetical protein n=1 Tax=unclassified Curtobacterium TaxID=257496 RepID=UPI0008DD253F|nr:MULTISPECIES: hypothetical protein [unclassified Curtobacterium]OIH96460.1 hypothetical protein BIU92_16640 [Curtobacterium sp. MCBA15_003]OII13835.1 hypothetical protein BIU97_16755 [Curtobacterium sp. MCBA15_009]OII33632.1 hypothetical protein BIU94_00665 [Curtobacterium sp. MMLR14_006]